MTSSPINSTQRRSNSNPYIRRDRKFPGAQVTSLISPESFKDKFLITQLHSTGEQNKSLQDHEPPTLNVIKCEGYIDGIVREHDERIKPSSSLLVKVNTDITTTNILNASIEYFS